MKILLVFLVLVAGYFILIIPNRNAKERMKEFYNWDYAHRGFHDNKGQAVENSILAIQNAVDNNYGIEFDVQITKDHIPVVFHDDNMKRLVGVDSTIDSYTYEELLNFTILDSQEKIPKLEDLLGIVDGKVPLIIEYKLSASTDTTICDVVDPYLKSYKGLYCIESFNPLILKWYRKNRPEVARGQLSLNYRKSGFDSIKYFPLTALLFNFRTRPDFIAFNYKDRDNLSLKILKTIYNLPMVAYTIKTQADYDNNDDFFDLLIFEGFHPKN